MVNTSNVSINTPKIINSIYLTTQKPEFFKSKMIFSHSRYLRSKFTFTHLQDSILHIYEILFYTFTRFYFTRLRDSILLIYETLSYTFTKLYLTRLRDSILHIYETNFKNKFIYILIKYFKKLL